MDMIKQQLQRIQDQLGSLSGTQRMLVFSLVTVMVLTVLLWSRYAATPDVVPLLNQAVQDQDLMQIQNALQSRGINVRSSTGNLMVSPDDRLRALAVIAPMNLLPSNSTNLMDEYLNGGNPFESQNKNDKRWQLYVSQRLRNVILMMDNVRDASVTVDPSNQNRFGGSISPTAAVFVKTASPEHANSAMVEGIAAIVTGSVAGLKKQDVKIVVNNRSFNLDSPLTGGLGSDLLERQAYWEQFNVKKVREALSHIDGLQVGLSVKINLESKQRRTHSIDDVKSKEAEINAKTSESGNSTPPPADPGVAANTGTLLAVPPAGGNSTTTEDTVTKMENFASTTDESSTTPAGDATVVAATVAIPRSYFVNSIKGRDPSAKDPDQNAVDAQIAAEKQSLQEQVRFTLGMVDTQNVLITSYVDTATTILPPDAAGGGGAGGIFTLALGGNMKEVLIGALALVSLFMLMMIVRKATPAPLRVPEPVKKSRPDVGEVDGNEPLIGIAASGNPTLEAMELGPEDMESQQVVDQVNTMVKEDPDAASQLIKRWLNRS